MTARRRHFEVVAPDWGQTHLTSDAIVAFVDGELSPGPHARATSHLDACAECAAEVGTQWQARSALRAADMPALSSSLLRSLREIPRDAELPGPPAGLAVGADGSLVQALRSPAPAGARPTSGRRRLGAGVAVSSLALGALALTVAMPSDPAPERGVFGGPVLDGAVFDARLQVPEARPLSSTFAEPSRTFQTAADVVSGQGLDGVMRQLDAMPATFGSCRR